MTILVGDCRTLLASLPDRHFNTCVTSPPYWGLRNYGVDGQIGLERSLDAYITELVQVFRGVRRVLRDDGTLWLNLGDCYANSGRGPSLASCGLAGSRRNHSASRDAAVNRSRVVDGFKKKDLIGVPWRVAFALQADGWYLRAANVWAKRNPVPESVKDRTTRSHELVFHFSKGPRYFYDHKAIAERAVTKASGNKRRRRGRGDVGTGTGARAKPSSNVPWSGETRNRRDVWLVTNQPVKGKHTATMPLEVARICVFAGCPGGGRVLDTFGGTGTTAVAAIDRGADWTLLELNPEYAQTAGDRCEEAQRRRARAEQLTFEVGA